MSLKKIVYKPENDFPAGSHPLMYQRPVVRPGAKKKNAGEAEELTGTWIRPGINELSEEEWAYILAHPDTEERLRRGVFKEIKPTLKADAVPTGTLADYSLADCRDIIYNTFDIDWLQRVRTLDTRPEIERYCKDRIAKLEEKSTSNSSYAQR